MIRLLHVLAVTVLIGSAAYAYSTKYETLFYAETLSKLKGRLQKEKEAIAVSKAEWALLTRPERLQRMVDRHLDLQPMTVSQLGRIGDLPTRAPRGDLIGLKLDALGLEPATTGAIRPPKRDGIGAKLDSLRLGDSPSSRPKAPTGNKPTVVTMKPPAAPPAKTAATKPAAPPAAKAPASAAPAPAKPATR